MVSLVLGTSRPGPSRGEHVVSPAMVGPQVPQPHGAAAAASSCLPPPPAILRWDPRSITPWVLVPPGTPAASPHGHCYPQILLPEDPVWADGQMLVPWGSLLSPVPSHGAAQRGNCQVGASQGQSQCRDHLPLCFPCSWKPGC